MNYWTRITSPKSAFFELHSMTSQTLQKLLWLVLFFMDVILSVMKVLLGINCTLVYFIN